MNLTWRPKLLIETAKIAALVLSLSIIFQSQAMSFGEATFKCLKSLRGLATKDTFYFFTGRDYDQLNKEFPGYLVPKDKMVGKKVLDVGAGFGTLVKELRVAGVDAYGVDRSRLMSWVGKIRKNPVLRADVRRELPFPSENFDYVYTSWSIFHSAYIEKEKPEDLVHALREINRIMKKGAQLRIVTETYSNIDFKALVAQVPELKIVSVLNGTVVIRRRQPGSLIDEMEIENK